MTEVLQETFTYPRFFLKSDANIFLWFAVWALSC